MARYRHRRWRSAKALYQRSESDEEGWSRPIAKRRGVVCAMFSAVRYGYLEPMGRDRLGCPPLAPLAHAGYEAPGRQWRGEDTSAAGHRPQRLSMPRYTPGCGAAERSSMVVEQGGLTVVR